MPSLSGSKVVVIGGSSGIGFGVAKAALAEGAHVVIASSTESKCTAAVERLGGGESVAAKVLDVNDEDAIKVFFEEMGTVDHLVFTVCLDNVARTTPLTRSIRLVVYPVYRSFQTLILLSFGEKGMAGVNIGHSSFCANKLTLLYHAGMLMCAKYAVGHVTGSFTCTSGTVAAKPVPGWSVIASHAGSTVTATKNLAIDLAPLRVNCIAPGAVATEMWDVSAT
jgi:NAD(P)-dependent dehydrogenase (short-subunit alcohol dehydrogenase family)